MKKRLGLALALLVASSVHAADETGTTSFHFLNLGTGARLEAMGTVGTTMAEEADAMDWNPARLAHARALSASAAWFSWLEGVQGGHVAAALPIGSRGIVLGFTARSLGVDEFDNTDAEDAVSQSDAAFAAAVATPIAKGLTGGVSLKLLTSDLANEKATGFAADAGLDYQWTRGWNVAAAARHLGPGIGYEDGLASQLPTQIAAGVGGTTRKVRYGVEGLWENGLGLGAVGGLEYTPFSRLALRAGTRLDSKPESAVEPWSAGAGFEVRPGLSVDYAFRDAVPEPSHRLGVRWEPGRRAVVEDDSVRTGPEFYGAMLDQALTQALAGMPGDAGDSVIIRPVRDHEAVKAVGNALAAHLREKGMHVEIREPVPDLPDSVRAARAAELEKAGLSPIVHLPLLEFDVRRSEYNFVRTVRDRWIGPRSVEREVIVDIGLAWKNAGESTASWTATATGSDSETIESHRILASADYPQPKSISAEGKKSSPLVEPAIVTGIVAGLAFLFFSNRDVGD